MVKNTVDPAKLQVGIRRLKNISKGGILVDVNTKADYEKLETELNTNEVLKEKIKIRKAEKLKPRVIIYNVGENLENDELLECLASQNDPLIAGVFNIEFKMKSRMGTNVIISTEPNVFQEVIKRGTLYIKWSRHNMREFIRPLRCFKRWKYGHQMEY